MNVLLIRPQNTNIPKFITDVGSNEALQGLLKFVFVNVKTESTKRQNKWVRLHLNLSHLEQ